jgi:hypothetical protein
MGQPQLGIHPFEKSFTDRGPLIIQYGVFQVAERNWVVDIYLQEIIYFIGDADSRVHSNR